MGMFNVHMSPVVRTLVLTVHQNCFWLLFHAQRINIDYMNYVHVSSMEICCFFYFLSKHLEVTVIGHWIKFSYERIMPFVGINTVLASLFFKHWIFTLGSSTYFPFTWHRIQNNNTDLFHKLWEVNLMMENWIDWIWTLFTYQTVSIDHIFRPKFRVRWWIFMRIFSSVCH